MVEVNDLNDILFLDIETVPQQPSYDKLDDRWKKLWNKKAVTLLKKGEEISPEILYERAGIYAEFGKIVDFLLSKGFLLAFSSTFQPFVSSKR